MSPASDADGPGTLQHGGKCSQKEHRARGSTTSHWNTEHIRDVVELTDHRAHGSTTLYHMRVNGISDKRNRRTKGVAEPPDAVLSALCYTATVQSCSGRRHVRVVSVPCNPAQSQTHYGATGRATAQRVWYAATQSVRVSREPGEMAHTDTDIPLALSISDMKNHSAGASAMYPLSIREPHTTGTESA